MKKLSFKFKKRVKRVLSKVHIHYLRYKKAKRVKKILLALEQIESERKILLKDY